MIINLERFTLCFKAAAARAKGIESGRDFYDEGAERFYGDYERPSNDIYVFIHKLEYFGQFRKERMIFFRCHLTFKKKGKEPHRPLLSSRKILVKHW